MSDFSVYASRFIQHSDGWRRRFETIDDCLIRITYEEWDAEKKDFVEKHGALEIGRDEAVLIAEILIAMKKDIDSL